MRIKPMFSSSNLLSLGCHVVFYCAVTAYDFLSFLYHQKLTSDCQLKVLVFSFLIFESGLIALRIYQAV